MNMFGSRRCRTPTRRERSVPFKPSMVPALWSSSNTLRLNWRSESAISDDIVANDRPPRVRRGEKMHAPRGM